MNQLTTSPAVARFGPYEVNTQSGEMRKFGIRIKLGEQPLRILVLLMERQGDLVTREELRSKLWSNDTFVDFDHSLNSAVQRLRESLSDTAEKAHWIETVPRRGYRFVGSVEWSKPNGVKPNGSGNHDTQLAESDQVRVSDVRKIPPPMPVPPAHQPDAGTRRWVLAVVVAAVLVAGLILWLVRHNSRPALSAIRSLAVIPLQNLSGDSSQEYFVDGMTDELITALAQNRSLRVTSRTSAMQYKKVQRPVRDIAKELGVDAILEGSVMRAGNRIHMTVQLIRAADDTHIWAESYDRDLNQALAIPSDLSTTVAREVRVAIASPAPPRYIHPEAHDAYLHGRFFWFSENDENAREYFDKAIRLQPDYAAAWSGLADYYALRAVGGDVAPQEVRSNWEADARKAIALDDSLSDVHNSLAAWYLFGAWDWKQAERESVRAIALNPNNAEPYHLHSYVLTVAGHLTEAVEEQKRGMEVDPFARPWALGYTYYRARQFDAAIADYRLRLQAAPKNSGLQLMLAEAYHFAGLEKEAIEELEQSYLDNGRQDAAAAIRRAFERGGFQAAALWRLQDTKAHTHGYFSPYWMALISGLAQQKEETLKLLEAAHQERSPRLVFVQNEPEFDFVHAEPRFQEIVRKMGLPTGQ
jgi:TolB-like protein/DNA-binding winged helix-turn-helix (wHTH) protein/Tfp pilus assembly protein PilF